MKRLLSLFFILIATTVAMAQGPTISAVAITGMTSTTATIQWTTNVPATSQVKYGNDPSIPYATTVSQPLVTSHTVTLILLQPLMYYFAVVSTDSGGSTQSGTLQFSICGKPNVPVSGLLNNYYQYGTYTVTWVPPAGFGATPTACGQPIAQTVTGNISQGGSISFEVADASKVVPGPGTWQINAADVGSIAPIQVTNYITSASQEISAQLQAAANASGLTACLTNTLTDVSYPSTCGTGGGSTPPSAPYQSIQLANSTVTGLTSDNHFCVNPISHTMLAGVTNCTPPSGNIVTAGPQSSVPASWTFDWTTPSTTMDSIEQALNGASYSSPAAAVTAACATTPPTPVWFPAGNYSVTTTISPCTGLKMWGVRNATQFIISGAIWGMANPNADSPSGNFQIAQMTVDGITWDIQSTPSTTLGAIRFKGINNSNFYNNVCWMNNNVNPCLTFDGGNFGHNGGDYNTNIYSMWVYNNATAPWTSPVCVLVQSGSNEVHWWGGGINRCLVNLKIASGNDNLFHGIDAENWVQNALELDTSASSNDLILRTETDYVPWVANNAYTVGTVIVDSNGNFQRYTTAGTSGATAPTWATTPLGATTSDGTAVATLYAINPADVLATGSSNNKICVYISGYENGVIDGPPSLNSYTCPIISGLSATGQGHVVQGFNNSNSTLQWGIGGLPNTANGNSPIFGPGLDINGWFRTQTSFLCYFSTGGCGTSQAEFRYTDAAVGGNIDFTSPGSPFMIGNGALPTTLPLIPTNQATVPSTNYSSSELVWQNSWYFGGLSFAQYTGTGASVTGTAGQTCLATTFNNGVSGAQVSMVLSATNTLSTTNEGTILAAGTGGSSASVPTTAVLSTGGSNPASACSGTISVSAEIAAGTGNILAFNAPGTGSNPTETLIFEGNGTTGPVQYFFEFGNNGTSATGVGMSLYNAQAATSSTNIAPPSLNLLGACWNGSATMNLYWNFLPDTSGNLAIKQTSGCGTGNLELPTFVPLTAGNLSMGTTALPWQTVNFGPAANEAVTLECTTCSTNYTVNFPNGSSQVVLVATLTSTSATSDNVTIQGMTSSGHCSAPGPTNSAAATGQLTAVAYVSAKTTNQVTVTHTATSGMTFDLVCTAN